MYTTPIQRFHKVHININLTTKCRNFKKTFYLVFSIKKTHFESVNMYKEKKISKIKCIFLLQCYQKNINIMVQN